VRNLGARIDRVEERLGPADDGAPRGWRFVTLRAGEPEPPAEGNVVIIRVVGRGDVDASRRSMMPGRS
jgi:hypothetical protein